MPHGFPIELVPIATVPINFACDLVGFHANVL